MKIKYSLKNHIANRFYIYLGALLLVPLLCSYTVLQMTKPKENERFSLFVDVELKNEGLLKDYLLDELKEDLVIDAYEMSRNDNLFNAYFSSYGLNSDICILSKETMDKFNTMYFLNLEGTVFDNADNYHFGNYSIGIPCHQKGSIELNEYFDFQSLDDDYYIAVSKDSVHLKDSTLNDSNNQIARVIKLLTNYE